MFLQLFNNFLFIYFLPLPKLEFFEFIIQIDWLVIFSLVLDFLFLIINI